MQFPRHISSIKQTGFSSAQIAIGSFLGGPLSAGFMIAHNFRRRKNLFAAFVSALSGTVIATVLAWKMVLSGIPPDDYMLVGFLFLIAVFVFAMAAAVLSEICFDINEEMSWRWAVVSGATGLVIQVALFFFLFYLFLFLALSSLN